MRLQFTWIEVNLHSFFLAKVRRSRGKFNEIRRWITTNPAPFGSRLSLKAEKSWWTQDFPSNSLNYLTSPSRVKRRRENTSVFKGKFFQELRTIWSGERAIDGHDRTMIVGHQCEAIVATIARWMSYDHASIRPRLRGNHVTIARWRN